MRTTLQSVFCLILSIGLLPCFGGCATPPRMFVEEPGDVTRYRTWDWLRDDGERVTTADDSALGLESQVARQIEKSLSDRGFRRVPGRADLLVHFHLTIGRSTVTVARTGAVQTVYSLHSSPSYEVQATRYEIRRYEIADLRVVLIDPRAKSVVWRGAFKKRYPEAPSPRLGQHVSQLLARIPAPRPRPDGPRVIVQEPSKAGPPPS